MTDIDGMSPEELRDHLRMLAAAHARARGNRRPAILSSAARASIEANRARVHGIQAMIDAERERKDRDSTPPSAADVKRTALVALRHVRAAGWHRPLWWWEYGERYDQATEARITGGRISIEEAIQRALNDVFPPADDDRSRASRWLRVHAAVTRHLAIATSSEPYVSTWESQPGRTQAEVIRAMAAVAMFSPAPAVK